jgi:hypothetical protein
LDTGGFFGAGIGTGADDDFEVAAEAREEVHEALYGETIEAIAGECGDFGLVDAEMAGSAGLGKAALGEDAVDGDGETDFGVFFLGVGEAEIGEDVAGAFEDGGFSGVLWFGVPEHSGRELNASWIIPELG